MPLPRLHVGIAGCGIAGLSAAIFIKKQGHHPVIFDQMEQAQPLGSGLVIQPTGISVLHAAGLAEELKKYGQPIHRLFGTSKKNIVLDVRYAALRNNYQGLAVHRAALFDVLAKAVKKAGITIHTNKKILSHTHGVLSFEDGGYSPQFDLVIDALGVRSPLRPKAFKPLKYGALWATLDWPEKSDFDPHTLEQKYKQAKKMVGVLPIGTIPGDPHKKATFFWSLKNEDYAQWQKNGLDVWKQEVRALWPETEIFLNQITHPAQLVMAQYAHQTVSKPYQDTLVHIGDSYHSASPQLGQGANMALLDAYALTFALQNTSSVEGALAHYHKLRQNHVRLYQFMAWAFTPVYQSDSVFLAFMRDHFVPPLANIPPFPKLLARIVAGTIGKPLQKLNLEIAP
ncbi:MAG TPA: FAD-dependent monooxygenase [Hellea balneolensis]|uniref:FAD-dependent monooxygenase n=1 Tax=Hellea balneolensis TaxID=287478 RepID=A0A7C3FXJ2_9PROT|nr:FAD-dependent monooxygenase [Hellea balneolensis]